MFLNIYATTFNGCYLAHFKPYEDELVHKLDLVNEVTALIMFGISYCFTGLVPNIDHH
jgi:hypothetical protein